MAFKEALSLSLKKGKLPFVWVLFWDVLMLPRGGHAGKHTKIACFSCIFDAIQLKSMRPKMYSVACK